MNDESSWYFQTPHGRIGPVGASRLRELRALGQVGPATLVWREGCEDWLPYAESELSREGARPVPPSLPLLSAVPPPVPSSLRPFVPRVARLRRGFRPSIGAAYGRAWEALTTRFWPLVGCFALANLMIGAATQLYVTAFFLIYPLIGGLGWYILKHLRGQNPNLEMLFEGFRRQFAPLAVLNLVVSGIGLLVAILVGVLIFGGALALSESGLGREIEGNPGLLAGAIGVGLLLLALLFVPLLLLGVVVNFAMMLILDCEVPVKRALSLGWRATRPHLFRFTLFMFVNMLLSLAGMLVLFVGFYVTSTWSSIALVRIYEDAFGDEESA